MSVTFMLENDDDILESGNYLNVANSSARVILRALNLHKGELCGTLTPEDCHYIADCIEEDVSNVTSTTIIKGVHGATLIDMGISLDRLRYYAASLRKLAVLAHAAEVNVIYA